MAELTKAEKKKVYEVIELLKQKQVTIKALTYNIERIGRMVKISIEMEIQ